MLKLIIKIAPFPSHPLWHSPPPRLRLPSRLPTWLNNPKKRGCPTTCLPLRGCLLATEMDPKTSARSVMLPCPIATMVAWDTGRATLHHGLPLGPPPWLRNGFVHPPPRVRKLMKKKSSSLIVFILTQVQFEASHTQDEEPIKYSHLCRFVRHKCVVFILEGTSTYLRNFDISTVLHVRCASRTYIVVNSSK